MSRQAHPVPAAPSAAPSAAPFAAPQPVRIGIFDSGVGGLSVMQAVRERLPHAELFYAADTANAPYGDRTEEFLCDRSERIARFLCDQGAQMVVVACNTATAAAVARLRATWPALPVVGVEPGVKPAVALSAAHRVGVLATTRTLASEKFRRLAEAHAAGAQLVLQPCPGLADAIESADDAAIDVLVQRYCAPLRDAGTDVAVLGCTHYVFARTLFERALPGVQLVDTAEAIARQTARFADELVARGEADADADAARPSVLRAWSSGSPHVLASFAQRWLGLQVDVRDMRC